MSFLIQGFFTRFSIHLFVSQNDILFVFIYNIFFLQKLLSGIRENATYRQQAFGHYPQMGTNERKKAKIVVAIRPFRMIDQNDQGRTTREKKNLRIKTLNIRENRILFAVLFLLLLFLFPKTHLILLLLFFSNLAKKNFVFLYLLFLAYSIF